MTSVAPVLVRMHPADNVAIVGNEGGLPAGTVLPEPASGLALRERVPQAHKVALVDIPAGAAVTRYGVTIGHALKDLPAGSWVHERVLRMPPARGLADLPMGPGAGAKAMVASVLSIKPIIEVRDGVVQEGGKQRTRSKALAFLVDKVRENVASPGITQLSVLQADCSDVDAFVAQLKSVYSGEIIVGDIGAVIGTHAGRGTIGVAFFNA